MAARMPAATALAVALAATLPGGAAAAERLPLTLPQCIAGVFFPGAVTPADGEGYGPTDVNAQTANRSLAVGLNRQGTVSVLRWPSPSYYDQVKYFTLDRDQPYFGAYPNEGAFLGLVVGGRTTWLRDWETEQRYASAGTDEVTTTYRNPRLGLEATVSDVAALAPDVLARRIEVEVVEPGARPPSAVVAFENFNLVVSKPPTLPGQDWCVEEQNVDRAAWVPASDAIVHEKAGLDSPGRPSSVAVAMGFAGRASGHQVGGDAHEPSATPDGGLAGPTGDAYLDAGDGRLAGNGLYAGQTTGAIAVPLRWSGGTAGEELYIAAGPDRDSALGALARARAGGYAALRAAKAQWLSALLDRAPMPDTGDERILALAKRALVLLLTTVDDETGAIVASITTQPPYGEDWPRDGAFFNVALERAGYANRVKRHNLFYSRTQATALRQPPGSLGIPPGNWAMNYYADGVVGGPIPWEIDETGLAAWTMWDHYEAAGDRRYLEAVYPAIRRAADFLVLCRDPETGLQCRATEDDNFRLYQQQTLTGAATTYLGLRSAEQAARALGERADARRFERRRRELRRAIDRELWDPGSRSYGHRDPTATGGSQAGASAEWIIWPVRFKPVTHRRITGHAERVWEDIRLSFQAPAGERDFGLYEAKGLIALARVYRATDPAKLARVRAGLEWIAHVQATPDTGILGETWKVKDGRVLTYTATPHLWEHTLFYLAALDAYGER